MTTAPPTSGPRIPRIQRGLVATGPGNLALKPVPVSKLEADEVLVRTAAVALNPSDHKLLDQSTTPGAIAGADFAGTVVRLGSPDSHLHIGDRVLGCAFGSNPGNPGNGAFSQYVVAAARLCVRLPREMDFPTAASLPMALFTSAFIFRSLGLDFDSPVGNEPGRKSRSAVTDAGEEPFVLVHGGATSTGTIVIQLLSLAGYTPIATCSPASAELVRSRGAVATFDYNDPTVRDQIRQYTRDGLRLAVDCIGSPETMALCYGAIGDYGGRYAALEQYPRRLTIRRRDVQHDWILGWTLQGKEVLLGGAYYRPARPDDRLMGEAWAEKMEGLLATGRLVPHPLDVQRTGGLSAVIPKVDVLRKGKVKGSKLVFVV
ncbi:GroES-like protein [Aspergillus heteromorphus CBS 117.55]|uniref:GroES-like protein n=1 Tax=Aspergillus heteromorphus CBS 117.55 TaxID=1448321 RepID=A0A317VGQ1_9EURO|nr:GroES-like protein [Aspergillus heteromorphus CBS 117.55]PWY71020.1 GroES-like protein [Aspergillus heteromorphus CBS 117.55]